MFSSYAQMMRQCSEKFSAIIQRRRYNHNLLSTVLRTPYSVLLQVRYWFLIKRVVTRRCNKDRILLVDRFQSLLQESTGHATSDIILVLLGWEPSSFASEGSTHRSHISSGNTPYCVDVLLPGIKRGLEYSVGGTLRRWIYGVQYRLQVRQGLAHRQNPYSNRTL